MDKARIILIEDDPELRDDFKRNLEVSGHKVIGQAGTVETAAKLVDNLTPDDVDIAIVDGNLRRGVTDGTDGERVSEDIHQRLGGVVVIGASMDGVVRGADMNVPKDDAWALDKMIREL